MMLFQKDEETDRMCGGRDIISKIHSGASNLLLLFLLGVFPLIYHDNYIDIQTCKAWTFRVAAGSYLVFEIVLLIIIFIRRRLILSGKLRLYMVFLLLFMGGVIISTAFSQWPVYSFNGNMGRNVGTLDFLLAGCVFLLMMRRFRVWKCLPYILLVLSGIEFLIIILNFWGLDPLKMYENLIPDQYHIFIGTIGNINVASGFLCIAVPAYMALFVISKGAYKKTLYGLLSCLGLYAGCASSCDSFLLGCAVTLVLIAVYLFLSKRGIRIFAACLFLFSFAATSMRVSLLLAQRASYSSPFLSHYEKDSFLASFINSPALVVCLCGSIIMWILSVLLSCDIQVNILRVLLLFVPVMLCAGILLFLAANFWFDVKHTKDLRWLKRFVINHKFGSGRGYIWRRSLDMWWSYDFPKKMIGCGTDCFYLQMVPVYGQEMMELFEEVFVDAHSELFQLLVTTGLIGTAGYFGFWSGILIRVLKRIKESPCILVGFVSIGAYMAQGMINNLVPGCLPIAFAMGVLLLNCTDYAES